ncbi:MAG TPA: hypothetical protein DDW52_30260 [Planctomycetaceae bacterium]|nr:hypothetical protein [Planctomycetaceae bacterium]
MLTAIGSDGIFDRSGKQIGLIVRLLILCCLPAHCSGQESPAIQFVDRTAESGITFEHFSGRTGKHFILETVTAGVVTFDYDNDGWTDIYLLNGAPLRGGVQEPPPKNRLYKNLGGFRFQDVTDAAGCGDAGFALGGLAADVDNDGDQDLYLANFGGYVLLENDGCGCFHRRNSSNQPRKRIGAGVAALDVENDGDLDLFTANYVNFSFDRDVSRTIFGVPAAPGPKDYPPDQDFLFTNDGSGGWADASASSGIASVPGPGMGVVAFDATGDGRVDIFVCNDSAPNAFWENLGSGKFEENALLVGTAYDVSGAQQATMGVDIADWNHDGQIDVVTTNFIDEIPTLYENSGQGYFDDVGPTVGLGAADRSVTWGLGFGDFDNDSWPDLFIASGHLISGVTALNTSETFEAPNLVLRNEQGRRFEAIPAAGGPLAKAQVSRGVALEDFNRDGLLDALVLNLNDSIQLLENTTESPWAQMSVRLIGTHATRDAVGARVLVKLEDGTELHSVVVRGRGYQGSFGDTLHFGTAGKSVSRVTVVWPSGQDQHIDLDGRPDRCLTVIEPHDGQR